MKPKPFASLNHLTVPVLRILENLLWFVTDGCARNDYSRQARTNMSRGKPISGSIFGAPAGWAPALRRADLGSARRRYQAHIVVVGGPAGVEDFQDFTVGDLLIAANGDHPI